MGSAVEGFTDLLADNDTCVETVYISSSSNEANLTWYSRAISKICDNFGIFEERFASGSVVSIVGSNG